MQLAKFYLDTNMWKLVCMSSGSMFSFSTRRSRNAAPTSRSAGQTLCELARTFEKNPQKGIELFQYLKGYVDLGIIAAHDNRCGNNSHGEIRGIEYRRDWCHRVFYGPD